MAPAIVALLAIGLTPACRSGRTPDGGSRSEPGARQPAVSRRDAPEFVRGPTGGTPVPPFIVDELAKGRKDGHRVLVYVGATWCEPCQRFHHAVEAGELDTLLRGVRLLEFDLDADRDALIAAGYRSKLIPLFVFPNDDGTASTRRVEGSIKGPSAVASNLAPRLRTLLATTASGG